MRFANEGEDLTGKVAVCSIGRPAIITGRGRINIDKAVPVIGGVFPSQVEVWQGLGLDGKGTWASSNPCIIAESGQEFHDKLVARFGGKMSA